MIRGCLLYSVLLMFIVISVVTPESISEGMDNEAYSRGNWLPTRNGNFMMDMNISDASIASFWGEAIGDNSGYYVSGAGDVNNDGYNDILIGAPFNDEKGFFAGQTYLIFGKSLNWSMNTTLSSANASFLGENAWDYSGMSLSAAGDVNGDGYDDILIGAYSNSDMGHCAGQTYLIFGKASGWSMDTDLSNANASFLGEDAEDLSGISVSGAGDVNGDGYDDILIGAMGDDDGGNYAGQTYLIFGKASGWSMDIDLSSADASFIGEDKGDNSSSSISGAGDVNGDGYDDILIGAYSDEEGGIYAGQTYLIFGKASGWSMDTDLSNADASFLGEDVDDQSGRSVSEAGDVNADGYHDILIGAYGDEEGGDFAGQTYLIFGKASGWSMDTDLSNANASFLGEDAEDLSGISVSEAGDVNADGYHDILIGAYGDEEGGDFAGQTYLIFGKASGWSMDTDLSEVYASFLGEDSDDQLGYSVSGAGDVDGDGNDDILIGANCDEEGGVQAGQTYLISGSGFSEPLEIYDIGITNEIGNDIQVADIGERIYVEITGKDSNATHIDRARVNVTFSRSKPNLTMIPLIETDKNTGIYRGVFVVPARARYFERMRFSAYIDQSKIYDVTVDYPYRPLTVNSLTIHPDPITTSTQDKFDFGDTAYFKTQGVDANPNKIDKDFINLSSNTNSSFAPLIICIETGENTGIYIGTFEINDEMEYFENIIAVSVQNPFLTAKFIVDYPFRPDPVQSLIVYFDPSFSFPTDRLELGETAYIRAMGTDSNPSTADKAFVNLSSDKMAGFNNPLVLRETGINTGIYIGNFSIPLTMEYPDNITLISLETPAIWTKFMVNTPIKLRCSEGYKNALEDKEYRISFGNIGYNVATWDVSFNAAWLSWDLSKHTLFGTPNNLQLGKWDVRVNISDGYGHDDELKYQITVLNAEPKIVTEAILEAIEDVPYSVDFNSDDDGQGIITWHLFTNAEWLTLDASSGLLSGIPRDYDEGSVDVTVSVDDGNNGWNTTTFNLTVVGINDRPQITNTDIHSIIQGDRYYRDYEVFDPDVGDVHTWSLSTNGTWLTLDSTTGVLQGTPGKWDIGTFLVNITVTDREGEWDSHEFEITVENINDRPEFTLVPTDIEITHGQLFSFDVDAIDPDPDTTLEYTIRTDPESDMDIDAGTGEIEWVADASIFNSTVENVLEATIKVSDGEAFSLHTFELTIIPTEPPTVSLLKPLKGSKTPSAYSLLQWEGLDPENESLIYTIYLDTSESFVSGMRSECMWIEEVGITEYNVTDLQPGTTYYWTVISFDGCSRGICSNGVFSFKVNNAPTLKSVSDQKASTGSQITIKVSGSDIDTEDRDSLRYYLYEAPEGMRINDETGRITWTPSDGQTGYHDVTVKYTDGIDTATVSFEIEVEKGAQQSMLIFLVVGALVLIIIVLIVFMILSRRKKQEEKEEGPKVDEESEEIARKIEEHRKEMEWEREHYRFGESNVVVNDIRTVEPGLEE